MPYNADHEWYDEPEYRWRLDANGNWLAPDGSLSDVVTAFASDPDYVRTILGATYGEMTNPTAQTQYTGAEVNIYNQAINTLANAGVDVTSVVNDPLFQSNAQDQLSYNYTDILNADSPTHSPANKIAQTIALAGLGAVAGPAIFGGAGEGALTSASEIASPLASVPADIPLPVEPTPVLPVEAPIPQPSPLETVSPPSVNTASQQALDDLIAKQQMLYPTIGNTTIGLPQVGNSVLQGAGKGAVTSALGDLAQNKPITLQDVATGALTGGVGGGAGNLATQFGGGAIGAGIAGGATGSATGALINGGDVGSSALKGALTGGISGATNDLLKGLPDPVVGAGKSIANGLTNAIISGNTNNLGTNLVTNALGSAGLTAVNGVIPPLSSIFPTKEPTPDYTNDVPYSPNGASQPLADTQTTSPLNTLSGGELKADPYTFSPLPEYPTFNPVASAPTGTTTQDTVLPNQSPLSTANDLNGTVSMLNPDGTPINAESAPTPEENYNQAIKSGYSPEEASLMTGYTPPSDNPIDFNLINNQTDSGGNNNSSSDNNTININTVGSNGSGTVSSGSNGGGGNGGSSSGGGNGNDSGVTQAIADLNTAQQKQVIEQVAQGKELTQAINDVQKNLTNSIDETQASNAIVINGINKNIGTLQSSVDSTNANNALSSLYNSQYKQPTETKTSKASTPSSLYTGDLLKNTNILQKLKGMYPQLNQVNPKILEKLGYPTESPLQSHTDSMGLTQANPYEHLLSQGEATPYKEGGHVPEFITGHTGHYADGKGDGQSDDIKALLNEGDYVMDAEAVAQLGNGSSKAGKSVLEQFRTSVPHKTGTSTGKVPAMIADGEYVLPSSFVSSLGKGDGDKGAKMLDKMRHALREHKRSAPLNKIPPPSKSPLEYLKDGSKMKETR